MEASVNVRYQKSTKYYAPSPNILALHMLHVLTSPANDWHADILVLLTLLGSLYALIFIAVLIFTYVAFQCCDWKQNR